MDKGQTGILSIAVVPALLSVAAGVLIRAFRPEPRARAARTGRMRPGWLAVCMESDAGDRIIAARCAAIMRYAEPVAGALCGPLQARKR